MEKKKTALRQDFQKTIYACFAGYAVQAIVNNFVPLLFLTFQSQYKIPLTQITLLVTINFGLQLVIDFLSAFFVDRIGYRISIVLAHVCASAGLILLTILPEIFRDPFWGILAAVMVYAVGGGLLEVLVSPIVEGCPTENKEKAMSMSHAFYCWGQVGVVLVSTVFFQVFGIANWKIMARIWAICPMVNGILFSQVPIAQMNPEKSKGMSLRELLRDRIFWVFILLMICSGASEQSVSQWASTFVEKGLGVSKIVGDLAGPMAFAVLMGTSRTLYGKFGEKIELKKCMIASVALCIAAYLLIVFAPSPAFGLLGCALSGFAVGIFWPGTFSIASATLKNGGTVMFSMLSLAGDLGCSAGPSLVGLVSGHFGDNLKMGILAALIFPVLLLVGMWMQKSGVGKREKKRL